MQIQISSITVENRKRNLRDITELAASIRDIGLLNPITLTEDNRLIAGWHRLEACKSLGWQMIEANVMSLSDLDAELAEIDENLMRHDLTVLEHSEHMKRRKEIYVVRYPGTKQGVAGAMAKNYSATPGSGVADTKNVKSFVNDTAQKTGKSKTVIKEEVQIAQYIDNDVKEAIRHTDMADSKVDLISLARMEPERQKEVAQKIANGEAKNVRDAARQIIKEEVKKAAELPTSKYRVIYADPPWKYGNTMPDYFSEQADHYPLMSIKEICEMPINDLLEDNAVLFLWVTSPILEESFQVINAWGFKYKSSFIWDKVKHNMGHYNSVRHELLLICTKGSCQPDIQELYDSVVTIERTEHSKKPDYFREVIDTIYTYGKRIELFARTQTEGWDCYGNQLPGTNIS